MQTNLWNRGATSRDLMILCRHFSTMLRAGVTVLHILQVLSQQADNSRIREKLREVCLSVEQGNTLSDSFKKHPHLFPPLFCNMVEAGEAGGMLDVVMENLTVTYAKQHDLEEKLRSAAVYPIAVTGVVVVVLAIMVVFILPRFATIFAELGVDLPRVTRAVLEMSRLLRQYWLLVAVLLLLVSAGLKYCSGTERGREILDRLRLSFPMWGAIYRKNLAARFSRTLGTLLSGGVGILTALDLVEKILQNKVLSQELWQIRENVQRGGGISGSLKSGSFFPPLMGEMVLVGEESGTLDSLLSQAADLYEDEVAYVVERLGSTLEPVLLIAISIIVGLLIISVTTPLFEIYRNI